MIIRKIQRSPGMVWRGTLKRGPWSEVLFEEGFGFVGAPAVAAFEQVELELGFGVGGGVNFFQLVVAGKGGVEQEAVVVGADFDEQRARCDESLQVGNIAQGVESG